MKRPSAGKINFYDYKNTLGVEVVYGRNVTHHFSRHTHRTLCVGVVEKGARTLLCRGEEYELAPGKVFVLPPNEAHSCGTNAKPHTYRLLLVSLDILTMILPKSEGDIYVFKHLVLSDEKLFSNLLDLHNVLMDKEPDFFKQFALLATLGEIVEVCADTGKDIQITNNQCHSVKQAQDFIEKLGEERFSLTEIARKSCISPYYLIRVFSHIVGIPPHIYYQQVRIRRAKEMLIRGIPIIDVANKTGFTDQSHFSNVFKKMVGVAPGEYVKS